MTCSKTAQVRCVSTLRRLLQQALSEELPKSEGQASMAPRPRTGWKPDVLPEECRDAAALLLLYPKDNESHVVLTIRTQQLPTHQGQVSLPGGGVHRGESLVDAALREAQEEVGVDPEKLHVLGMLSPLHIPVSGFILHTVVAVSAKRLFVRPQAGEVERILEVPLMALCGTERIRVETWMHEGHAYRVPFFWVEHAKVWGATAMVLSEFLHLIGFPPSPHLSA